MKSKKTITITTKAFSLQLYWNGLLASAQIAILLGLLVLYIFAIKPEMISFCKIVLGIDVLALLIYTFYGMKVEVTEGEGSKPSPTPKPAQVDSNNNTNSTNQSSVKQTNGKINNKVPMPNQQGVQRVNSTPEPQPQAQPQPQEQVSPEQAEADAAKEGQKVSRELSQSDWEDLFSM